MIIDITGCENKVITYVQLRGKYDDLLIGLGDHDRLRIWDGGQSCCEDRYMTTDDDLTDMVGQKLISIRLKKAPDSLSCGVDSHEVMFLEIQHTGGSVILETHNEHNGYYGGFSIKVAKTLLQSYET